MLPDTRYHTHRISHCCPPHMVFNLNIASSCNMPLTWRSHHSFHHHIRPLNPGATNELKHSHLGPTWSPIDIDTLIWKFVALMECITHKLIEIAVESKQLETLPCNASVFIYGQSQDLHLWSHNGHWDFPTEHIKRSTLKRNVILTRLCVGVAKHIVLYYMTVFL